MNIPRREGCVGSLTLTRDKTNSQYISKCNPHLTSQFCGVELDFKLTSNIELIKEGVKNFRVVS